MTINTEQMTTTNTEIPEQILLKTLRFKFSEEVMEQIFVFAKIHANDDCKTFKESWNEWLMDVDNKTLINNETERVNALGFKGDIIDKMYKSARYYYRKKPLVQTPPADRKEYENVPKIILETMDAHIKLQIASKIKNNNDEKKENNPKCKTIDVKPAESFINYCILHQEIIIQQINNQYGQQTNIHNDEVKKITDKMKKIYKNRFYNIRVKLL
jgi:hypothetical protein